MSALIFLDAVPSFLLTSHVIILSANHFLKPPSLIEPIPHSDALTIDHK